MQQDSNNNTVLQTVTDELLTLREKTGFLLLKNQNRELDLTPHFEKIFDLLERVVIEQCPPQQVTVIDEKTEKKLQQARRIIEKLLGREKKIKKLLRQIEEERDELKGERDHVILQIASYEKEAKNLTDNLNACKNNIEQLTTQVDELQKIRAEMITREEKLKSELKNVRKEIEIILNKNRKLRLVVVFLSSGLFAVIFVSLLKLLIGV